MDFDVKKIFEKEFSSFEPQADSSVYDHFRIEPSQWDPGSFIAVFKLRFAAKSKNQKSDGTFFYSEINERAFDLSMLEANIKNTKAGGYNPDPMIVKAHTALKAAIEANQKPVPGADGPNGAG